MDQKGRHTHTHTLSDTVFTVTGTERSQRLHFCCYPLCQLVKHNKNKSSRSKRQRSGWMSKNHIPAITTVTTVTVICWTIKLLWQTSAFLCTPVHLMKCSMFTLTLALLLKYLSVWQLLLLEMKLQESRERTRPVKLWALKPIQPAENLKQSLIDLR